MRHIHPGLSYAQEKFTAAKRTLATSPGRVNERLLHAFTCFENLKAADFPAGDTRAKFERLNMAPTRVPAEGRQRSVQATLAAMTEGEAVEVANLICDIEYEVGELITDLEEAS